MCSSDLKGLEHIRSTDWFQKSDKDVQGKVEGAFNDYFKDAPKTKTPGERRIQQIQNRIDDIRSGKVKEKKEAVYTPEEKAEIDNLTAELEDLKKTMGVTPSKPLPKAPKTAEEKIGDMQSDLQEQFADKDDNKFTPEEAADIWDYAKKAYVDKGSPIEDMFQNVARDIGLTPDQVRNALASDKSTKTISDDMYKLQNQRRQAERAAKAWLESQKDPKSLKFLKSLPDYYFGLKTALHGTVEIGRAHV